MAKDYIDTCQELLIEWNWDKNTINPSTLLCGSGKKVWWICSEGHEWEASPHNRYTHHSKCPYCRSKKTIEGFNDLATTDPFIVLQWDYEKNQTLLPTQVTAGSNRKVWWVCEYGHSWQDTICHRTIDRRNCPVCSGESKTSFAEQAIYFYFNQITATENRYKIEGKEIDIFLKELNVGIEYNGSYWHKDKSDKDKDKINFLKSRNIRIITVADGKENKIENNCIIYNSDLDFAIKSLFNILQIPSPIINTNKDRIQIYEQYLQLKQNNSLLHKFPEIAAEWCYAKNGTLTPDMFDYSSNKSVWWQCNKCGNIWENTINHRTSRKRCGCPNCNRQAAGFKNRSKNHYKSKPIVQCTTTGEVIDIWYSAADVERNLHICHSNITACCKMKKDHKQAGGYRWYYLYDQNDGNTIIYGAISLGILSNDNVYKYKQYNKE